MATHSTSPVHRLDVLRLRFERLWQHPRTPALVLALLCLLAFAAIWRAGRGLFFFGDEWAFLLHRRGISADTFLQPHNQHPSVGPVAGTKLLLAVFGMDSYRPFQVAVALLHLLCGVFTYLYARPRLGARLALIPAALILFLGAAWEDVMWGFQTGFIGSVTFGLGALVAFDGGRRRDWLTCLALLVAVTSSSIGLPFVIVVGVLIALAPDPLRRAWVVVVPVLAYAVIVFGFGVDADAQYASPSAALRFAIEMAASGFGAVAGALGVTYGRPLMILGVLGLVLGLRKGHVRPTVALLALVLGAAGYWLLIGAGRAEIAGLAPDSSRYTYASAVFLVAIGTTVLAGRHVSVATGWALAGVTFLACVSAVGQFQSGPMFARTDAGTLPSKLAGIEAGRTRVANPNLQILPSVAPDIDVRSYLDAVDSFGSPAPTVAELRGMGEQEREAFDHALIQTLGVGVTAGAAPGRPAGAAPQVAGSAGVTDRASGACVVLTPASPGATVDLTLPADATYAFSGDAGTVTLRRLGDGFVPEVGWPIPAGASKLELPRDGVDTPWHARLTLQGELRACSV